MSEFSARYESSRSSVPLARHAVADFARSCGFCEDQVADIESAAGEALANAAEHGHRRGGRFRVRCRFDGDELSVEVRDAGRGFDESTVPSPAPDYSIRGFGIFLMHRLVDSVNFFNNGTTVRLSKTKAGCPCYEQDAGTSRKGGA